MFYLHFENEFYKDFTSKLLNIIIVDKKQKNDKIKIELNNSKSIKLENDININLIRNSTFNYGKTSWWGWNENCIINKPNNDKKQSSILQINNENLIKDITNDRDTQLWSNAIEVNASGKREFTVSFDIKVDDISNIDNYQAIFSIRTFNSSDKYLEIDSEWDQNILISSIDKIRNGEWIRYNYTFKPIDGKFIRVAPYLFSKGNVYWREIKLEMGSSGTKWVPGFRED